MLNRTLGRLDRRVAMGNVYRQSRTAMERFKSGGGIPFYYWLAGGLIAGLLIGWFFHGVITMVLRLALLFGVIAVIAIAVYLWQSSRNRRPTSGSGASDIPEGTWRNIDPTGKQ